MASFGGELLLQAQTLPPPCHAFREDRCQLRCDDLCGEFSPGACVNVPDPSILASLFLPDLGIGGTVRSCPVVDLRCRRELESSAGEAVSVTYYLALDRQTNYMETKRA